MKFRQTIYAKDLVVEGPTPGPAPARRDAITSS